MKLPGKWARRRAARLAAEGRILLKRGETDAAEAQFRSALAKDAEAAEALLGCAEIALRRENTTAYLELANRLLRLNEGVRAPERVAICHRQADMLLRQGNDPAAVEALARIEVDYPGSADAARAKCRIERILDVAQRRQSQTEG